MCALCEGGSREQYLEQMAQIAADTGWAVQALQRDGRRPPWAYTVGLTVFDRPELVVTGMTTPRAVDLLNGMAAHLLHAEAPPPGEQVTLVGGPLVEFVALPHPDVHLRVAVELYGPAIRGLQMVWADDRGRWPWESGFRSSRGGQPVLGPRAES